MVLPLYREEFPDEESMNYIINHVFMPRDLPAASDHKLGRDAIFLDYVLATAHRFSSTLFAGGQQDAWNLACDGLLRMFKFTALQESSEISGRYLRREIKTLQSSSKPKGYIPIFVFAQNAAILIHFEKPKWSFEVFELMPRNAEVYGTNGRLKRSFPDARVEVHDDQLSQNNFIPSTCRFLETMSTELVAKSQAFIVKAGNVMAETRDQKSPRMISHFLVAMLLSIGVAAPTTAIEKHLRDEVIWSQADNPWRRSSFWLMLKVSVQLMLYHELGDVGRDVYKSYMAYFMAFTMNQIAQTDLVRSDRLHNMACKLARRVHKLERLSKSLNIRSVQYASQTIRNYGEILKNRYIKAETVSGHILSSQIIQDSTRQVQTNFEFPELESMISDLRAPCLQQRATDMAATDPFNTLGSLDALIGFMEDQATSKHSLKLADVWMRHSQAEHWATTKSLSSLLRFIKLYWNLVHATYINDPIALSRSVLTTLRLWMIIDKIASSKLPAILGYSPSLPSDCFRNLTLYDVEDYELLHDLETYVSKRHEADFPGFSYVIGHFGETRHINCEVYDGDSDYARRLAVIQRIMQERRDLKANELSKKQELYADLKKRAKAMDCQRDQVIQIDRDGHKYVIVKHAKLCEKCRLVRQAEGMTIAREERLLPELHEQQKCFVVELNPPEALVIWREATMFLHEKVLGVDYYNSGRPHCGVTVYSQKFLQLYITQNNISIATSTKPHSDTHRKGINLSTATLDDVLVAHAARWQYHDHFMNRFYAAVPFEGSMSDKIFKSLRFQMPPSSRSLDEFVARRKFGGNLLSLGNPNQAIAGLSQCPKHLMPEEFYTLASIPFGPNLQWPNILLQIASPQIDLNKEEARVVIFQCLYQTGMPSEDSVRFAHQAVTETLGQNLVAACAILTNKIQDNWACATLMSIIISILTRLAHIGLSKLSELLLFKIQNQLSLARATCRSWSNKLSDKIKNGNSDPMIQEKRNECILLMADTFCLPRHLNRQMMSTEDWVVEYLETCILTAEVDIKGMPVIMKSVMGRWSITKLGLLDYLLKEVEIDSTAVYRAIKQYWAAFNPTTEWDLLYDDNWYSHYLVCNSGENVVQFDILSGALTVDGVPAKTLPEKIRLHPVFKAIFGAGMFEVVPSTLTAQGYSIMARQPIHGHQVHIASSLRVYGDELQVGIGLVDNKNVRRDLLPKTMFRQFFPENLIDGYTHWFNQYTGHVEFWRLSHVFSRSIDDCVLYRKQRSNRVFWELSETKRTMVPRGTQSFNLVEVVRPLEPDDHYIEVFLRKKPEDFVIHLVRANLSFYIPQGESEFRSEQFNYMKLSPGKSLGTLFGIKNKLLLRHLTDQTRAKVLVLGGYVTTDAESKPSEPRHQIRPSDKSRVHVYDVDFILGRLIDNGTLLDKVYLAYLHAISTLHCRPDTLTGVTGTERALEILQSAAIQSAIEIPPNVEEILVQIASLAPKRHFYPHDMKVMQDVAWRNDLDAYSQHDSYRIIVEDLYDKVISIDFLYNRPKTKKIEFAGSRFLAERALVKSTEYDVTGIGPSILKETFDDAPYAIQCPYTSESFLRCYRAISAAFHGTLLYSSKRVKAGTEIERLWQLLRMEEAIHSIVALPEEPSYIFYVKEMLVNTSIIFRNLIIIIEQIRSKTAAGDLISLSDFAYFLGSLALDKSVSGELMSIFLWVWHQGSSQLKYTDYIVNFSVELHPKDGFQPNAGDIRSFIMQSCLEEEHSPHLGGSWPKLLVPDTLRHLAYQVALKERQKEAAEYLVKELKNQFPILRPNYDGLPGTEWFQMGLVKGFLDPMFESWYRNHMLLSFLKFLSTSVTDWSRRVAANRVELKYQSPQCLASVRKMSSVVISPVSELFKQNVTSLWNVLKEGQPVPVPADIELPKTIVLSEKSPKQLVNDLINQLSTIARSPHHQDYVEDLRHSNSILGDYEQIPYVLDSDERRILEVLLPKQSRYLAADQELLVHLLQRRKNLVERANRSVERIYEIWCESRNYNNASAPFFFRFKSPMFFLSKLAYSHRCNSVLSESWHAALTAYGISLTHVQRASRMLAAYLDCDKEGIISELCNPGHVSWDPALEPDSLLVEVESNILIRDVQHDVAELMKNPPANKNTVTQLNMGEGKSSVIVPIVASALGDSTRIICIVVGKPQAPQMLQSLLAKLGNMVNRPIFMLPYNRDVHPDSQDVKAFRKLLKSCKMSGGVLLLHPEHILSLKLAGIEARFSKDRQAVGKDLVQIQGYMDAFSRFIVDESDENFSVKFELVYTIGDQQPIKGTPERWVTLHEILDLIPRLAKQILQEDVDSVEYSHEVPGHFPRIRILTDIAMRALNLKLADTICENGLCGFPITSQSQQTRDLIKEYIVNFEVSIETHQAVENIVRDGEWSQTSKNILLLLRGLIGCGVLNFVFMKKRWRVDYGLDDIRVPATRLAVPYRAKDNPSARAEFSHPDAVMALTCLSYYYGGLTDEQLFQCFNHLKLTGQSDVEYARWTRDLHEMPEKYKMYVGVNLKDHTVCLEQIFPHLRLARAVVNYFLANIIFPREMREFPQRISASGWDLAEVKKNPTTGFSGTNDSQALLPLDIRQHDREKLKGTNALVLSYLLGKKTSVAIMNHGRESDDETDAQFLLRLVVGLQRKTRVIIDVGAQILELNNEEVARQWLKMTENMSNIIKAVIFFSDNDQLIVMDRQGKIEPLQTSHYADRLDLCLVFMDEAHTRGTDLKLPKDYQAAVTLGPSLTKDRLTQACMRMRRLGHGQNVVFCVPVEIQNKIIACRPNKDPQAEITVMDILLWSIQESWSFVTNNIPLWTHQGIRHRHGLKILGPTMNRSKIISQEQATKFLESEAKTLEQRYKPQFFKSNSNRLALEGYDMDEDDPIFHHANRFTYDSPRHALLGEEQERELAPEAESEREIQHAFPAKAVVPSLDSALVTFIRSGKLLGFCRVKRAWECLEGTSILGDFSPSAIPGNLLVTCSFAQPVVLKSSQQDRGKSASNYDVYLRPVQWVLVSHSNAVSWPCMIVISPYEAQGLFQLVRTSKFVSMHIYAPRTNQQNPKMEHLSLFQATGCRHVDWNVGGHFTEYEFGPNDAYSDLIRQLNLFAGQLYFHSFSEYQRVCQYLGLLSRKALESEKVSLDGFILQDSQGRVGGTSEFRCSPVEFIRRLMQARRGKSNIARTHVGMMLNNCILTKFHFMDDPNPVVWKQAKYKKDGGAALSAQMRLDALAEGGLFVIMPSWKHHLQVLARKEEAARRIKSETETLVSGMASMLVDNMV